MFFREQTAVGSARAPGVASPSITFWASFISVFSRTSSRLRPAPQSPSECGNFVLDDRTVRRIHRIGNGASWLPRIYRDRIFSLSIPELRKHAQTEIHHTCWELLKVAAADAVPDLRRYLASCADSTAVAIPDIRPSAVADELESSRHRMLPPGRRAHKNATTVRTRLRRQLVGKVSAEKPAAGCMYRSSGRVRNKTLGHKKAPEAQIKSNLGPGDFSLVHFTFCD